jgi:CheY-like chemotaxis protein
VNTQPDNSIRVLIADDDEHILACYRSAFGNSGSSSFVETLSCLEAELFDPQPANEAPRFDVVACSQGRDAISLAVEARQNGKPFDVVILDVRMPPGIDGVEAGSRIREFDPEVEIVFVTGFSDLTMSELASRVPPPVKLHYFNKPLSFMQLAESVADMVRAG